MKTIIKINAVKDFTQITNNTIRDGRLSWAATGLLLYLLSLPEEWDVSVTDLACRKRTSKYEVRKLLAELISSGYVEAYSERDKNGRIYKGRYIVYEVPQTKISADNKTLEINEFLA